MKLQEQTLKDIDRAFKALEILEDLKIDLNQKACEYDEINNPWGDVYTKNPYKEILNMIKEMEDQNGISER